MIIYLNPGRIKRIENGKEEEVRGEAGAVVWRSHSQHEIENLSDADHEVIIVELK